VLDDASLADWCGQWLGARPARVLFRSGHLAQVTGLELEDGRSAVVKVRSSGARVAGCTAVQRHLAAAGFPCPAPLAGPAELGGLTVTAEALVPGGTTAPPAGGAGPFAGLLARLVRLAPAVGRVPSLAPAPPWAGWDHPGSRLWPDRDDHGRDLNDIQGPAWVDDAAGQVRRKMACYTAPLRIGHGDWEAQNIRWAGGQVLAVDDWDSVIAQPEPAIAGLAAAVWPAAGEPDQAATTGQSTDFLTSYQQAAGASWDQRDIQHAWAAGLWVRLFNAKKDAAAGGDPQLDRLAAEINQRLSLAALKPDR
jgi:Phosphotransferase enzyme family